MKSEAQKLFYNPHVKCPHHGEPWAVCGGCFDLAIKQQTRQLGEQRKKAHDALIAKAQKKAA